MPRKILTTARWVIAAVLLPAALAAAAEPVNNSGPPSTTGEQVNAMIDNLLATGTRILELPLFMVLAVVVLLCALLALAGRQMVKGKRPQVGRALLTAALLVVFLGGFFVVDRKISALQNQLRNLQAGAKADSVAMRGDLSQEINNLRAQTRADNAALADRIGRQPATGTMARPAETIPADARRPGLLYDPVEAKKRLDSAFKDLTIRPLSSDEAVNIVQLHSSNPLDQAYVAVIDLANPAVTIKLGGTLDTKTLTSDFAKKNDCVVAINGEAGQAPDPGSGLGSWRGVWMVDGKTLMTEQANNPRPLLAFDKAGRATFKAFAAKDRAVPADAQNVIWGRLDALIDGVVQTADERFRQPRTAMGINREGTRLYLMVVDGRQQNYSLGFTRAEVGQLLKAFGAHNAMLCDEGGSSCIYIKPFGICNVPSDGEERVTYTHFGVIVKAE